MDLFNGGNSQKLNEGELALYSMQLSAGYVPVGVDLAARVLLKITKVIRQYHAKLIRLLYQKIRIILK